MVCSICSLILKVLTSQRSFLGQVPFAVLGIVLVWYNLPHEESHEKDQDGPKPSKLGRVDFLGAILMALTILAFLIPLEIGGVKIPWSHSLIPGLLGSACALGALFLASQAYFAKEPIFPLELLRIKDFVASNMVMSLQTAAQMGVSENSSLISSHNAES